MSLYADIQRALSETGVPTYNGKWVQKSAAEVPPAQYLIWQTTTREDLYNDDALLGYRIDVYVTLYSDIPTDETIAKVRAAMYDLGFAMLEERNDIEFDNRTYMVAWTWRIWERIR